MKNRFVALLVVVLAVSSLVGTAFAQKKGGGGGPKKASNFPTRFTGRLPIRCAATGRARADWWRRWSL